jgi:Chaperone of endosialidase
MVSPGSTNASVGVSDINAGAAGFSIDTSGRLIFCLLNPDGSLTDTLGFFDTSGNLTAAGSVIVNNDADFTLWATSTTKMLTFAAGRTQWEFDTATGELAWLARANAYLHIRSATDSNVWNWVGTFVGQAPFIVNSDARAKRDIETVTTGLDAIKRLRPVRFVRTGLPREHAEIGFIAQELAAVLPEAVWHLGTPPVADGPQLGMTIEPIVAALVNAVQEIAAFLVLP